MDLQQLKTNIETGLEIVGAAVVGCELTVMGAHKWLGMLEKLSLTTEQRGYVRKIDAFLMATYQSVHKVSAWIPRAHIPAVKK